jgi:uncharacterized protein (TIGR00369 family)
MTAFPDDFDPVRFIKTMARNGHSKMMGLSYHAHGDNWVELAMPYSTQLVSDSGTGILASGPIFTMMDMTATISLWLTTRSFQPQATLDMRIDYLRPAKPGNTIYGRGECYHLTKSVAFVRGQAHDGNPEKPVAHVTGTYFFTAAA